jgi:hypothetical protein
MPASAATRTSDAKAQVAPIGAKSEHAVETCSPQPYSGILRLQRAVGNRAVDHLIQTKLSISMPGDRYEVEADRVADQVMNTPPDRAGANSGITGHPGSTLQRACDKCDEELQRKAFDDWNLQCQAGSAQSAPAPPNLGSQINSARGSGVSLPNSSRVFFESRFGYDFSQVRIHTGANATSLARSVNARAFTVGHEIFFGVNQYSPEAPTGRRLIAHELTHVLQQSPGLKSAYTSDSANQTPATISIARKPESAPAEGDLMLQRDGIGALDIAQGLIDPASLVGKAWLLLPTWIKAKVIDKAIDANLLVVEKFPGAVLLGSMWALVKAGLIGFWERLKSAKEDLKIKAADTMARIMSGSSDYALGMLKGLATGFFVEGAAGIFIAVWDLFKALKGLWGFFQQIGEAIGGFPQDIKELVKSFTDFGETLVTNIGPAIQEFVSEAKDPKNVGAFLTSLAEKAKGVAKAGGEKIADTLLEMFTKKGAEAEIGESVGSVIGQVLWEVVFAVVTYGAGAAVTAEKTVIKEATRILAKVVGKIAGSILKLVKEIEIIFAKVGAVVKKAVAFVKGKLAAIGGKFGEFADKVGAFLKKLLSNCHESKFVCDFAKKIVKAHEVVWKGFTKGKLAEHFTKHGAEFGAKNSRDYLKMAEAFAAKTGSTVREHKVGNTIFKYEEATNSLFIGNAKGPHIKTFYKPRDGLAGYFTAIKEYIETVE